MIKDPTERGKVALYAKDLGINPRTAMRWWKHYQKTGKVVYKKLQKNPGRPNSLTPEHEHHIQQIVEKVSQLCADDIIDSLKSQFEDLKISKSQMNHHLRNNMLISIKKPNFDPMTRNSDNNLQTRYEWFMKWKGSDLGYTKNCAFIDKAALKTAKQKRRKLAGGKEQRAGSIIIEEPTIEYVDVEESTAIENNKSVAKGTTTAHFVRLINELLDIMNMDESLMGSYLAMYYSTIHKSHPMIRKIESRDYRVIYLPPCSPELNPIEQF
ncbi:hypothetical protein G6F37_002681 [Rhizopus arrhizus]|nr:hypothetical protein G6F38_002735 [Rhizopus arrhizus]KAG1161881.1 hypothetical protein G6F37_002681 [Rhizopus arrhizus]